MDGKPDRQGWTLGLRGRTALAMIVAVTTACAALTLTTTQSAAAAHDDSQERVLSGAADRMLDTVACDSAQLLAALETDPTVDSIEALEKAGWDYDACSRQWQGVLIPADGSLNAVDPGRAIQWLGISQSAIARDQPECLAIQQQVITDQSGVFFLGRKQCGSYLMAYAFTQLAPGETPQQPWLVVRALYLPDNPQLTLPDPVPALRTTLLLCSTVIIAASVALALILARSIVAPVTRASTMATAVAQGDLTARVPVRGHDDLAAMSEAVNTMADRLTAQITALEQAGETQRRFVSDVAHELRTPAAALLASAESLANPSTRDEAALLVAPQLRRLAALTEDLLEIGRMDAGRAEIAVNSIDIVDLIAEVIAGDGAAAYKGPVELAMTTDPVRLQTILRNLVGNAVQHGAPPVTVTLTPQASQVRIEVHDAGAGVPAGLRERIFDRFVRGDESRHGSSSGLGLAIAAENARLLGGDLSLRPDGATFRLTLPANMPEPESPLPAADPLGATP